MQNSANRKTDPKRVAVLGMFCAIAYAVMYLSKLIPINIAGFLSLDFKDVVIVICGFLYGPAAAALVTVVVSLVEMITVSSTGIIGCIMNILSTCAFACPAALLYKSKHSFSGALHSLIVGIIFMTIVMVLWNWLITPLYMHVDRAVVAGMLLPVFLPFNLIKGAMNSAGAMLLYKPIVTALRKSRLVESGSSGSASKKGLSLGVTIASIVVLVSLVLVVLVWAGAI